MIAIIDYGRGNLFSLSQALRHLEMPHCVTDNPEEILGADQVILPGVGAFGDAISTLRDKNLVDPLRQLVAQRTPLIGICLGMQLLGTSSDEFGNHAGLDLIHGQVTRIPNGPTRVPNVGWRQLQAHEGPFKESLADAMVYFVHSYHLQPEDPAHVAASITVNGLAIAAAVRHGNVMGCQFHPEKSGRNGLKILAAMLSVK